VVLSQFCVRFSFGRVLHHNINLGGLSPWDYLHLGMPADIPLDTPFPPPSYFWDITHDEDRLLFGGPYGGLGEVAFQRLVSESLKDEEELEVTLLKRDVKEIEEMSDDTQNQEGFDLDLERMKLRLIRLTKRAPVLDFFGDLFWE
jgi:hypothetical protein